ncbi:helix-turn-helix transcriptional regulator [Limosilactobacillus pontis]|uniref:helix-turn-helix transcriptional regulator n=1 Tax=Limosilactobacillus pontis TaxID=35787 RepID=UPI002F26440E
MKTDGNKIEKIRLSLGKTQEGFGQLFNPSVSGSAVSRWENGDTKPNKQRMKRIAELAGISVESLCPDLLTEEQRNCPYCHSEKPLFSVRGDEIVGYIANCLDSQRFTVVYDFPPESVMDAELVNASFGNHKCAINYCPMCGRPLSKEVEP